MALLHKHNNGFTLIEVMVALAILGMAVVVLLDTHFSSLRLLDDARHEAIMMEFVESAMGQAEIGVLSGKLTGSGDFGKRNPDYKYTYAATQNGTRNSSTSLYEVTVTVTGPEEDTRTYKMLVCPLGATR